MREVEVIKEKNAKRTIGIEWRSEKPGKAQVETTGEARSTNKTTNG